MSFPGVDPGIQNHVTCAPSPRPHHLIVWVKLIVELHSRYVREIKAFFTETNRFIRRGEKRVRHGIRFSF
jgi:hypothetical protein